MDHLSIDVTGLLNQLLLFCYCQFLPPPLFLFCFHLMYLGVLMFGAYKITAAVFFFFLDYPFIMSFYISGYQLHFKAYFVLYILPSWLSFHFYLHGISSNTCRLKVAWEMLHHHHTFLSHFSSHSLNFFPHSQG